LFSNNVFLDYIKDRDPAFTESIDNIHWITRLQSKPTQSNHNHTGHDLPLPIKTSRPSKNTPQNLEHLREKRKKKKKDTTASLEERHKICKPASTALFIRLIIRLFQLFFQPKQYFSLITNQSTVFFNRLISTAERLLLQLRERPSFNICRISIAFSVRHPP
jgi:hypothetical protein